MAATAEAPGPGAALQIITIDNLPPLQINAGKATTIALYRALHGDERASPPNGVRTRILARGGIFAMLPVDLARRACTADGKRAIAHAWGVDADALVVREPRAPERPDQMLFFAVNVSEFGHTTATGMHADSNAPSILLEYCTERSMAASSLRLFRPHPGTRTLNGALSFPTAQAAAAALASAQTSPQTRRTRNFNIRHHHPRPSTHTATTPTHLASAPHGSAHRSRRQYRYHCDRRRAHHGTHRLRHQGPFRRGTPSIGAQTHCPAADAARSRPRLRCRSTRRRDEHNWLDGVDSKQLWRWDIYANRPAGQRLSHSKRTRPTNCHRAGH